MYSIVNFPHTLICGLFCGISNKFKTSCVKLSENVIINIFTLKNIKFRVKNLCEIFKMPLWWHAKNFLLHWIVTSDEKWIYSENPKFIKSCVNTTQPLTTVVKLKSFESNSMLCIWWNQEGVVYYKLRKQNEIVYSAVL